MSGKCRVRSVIPSSASGIDPSRRAAPRTPRRRPSSGLAGVGLRGGRHRRVVAAQKGIDPNLQCHGRGQSWGRLARTPVPPRPWYSIAARLAGSTVNAKRRLAACIRGRRTPGCPAAARAGGFNEAVICVGVPSNIRPQPALNSVSPQNSAPCPQRAMWLKVCPGTCKISKQSPKSGNSQRSPSCRVSVRCAIRGSSGPITGTGQRRSSSGTPPM